MALSTVKSSTQDSSNGTPVASAAVADGSSGTIQANALVGLKTDYAELSRTVSAADAPTGGDMTTVGFAGSAGANLGVCGNALTLAMRATCTAASATLTGRVVLYDGSNGCLALSEAVTFVSDATRRLGNGTGDFLAPRSLLDAGQAVKFRFFAETVSSGTWTISIRPI